MTRSTLSRILCGPVLLAALIGATACGGSEPAQSAAPEPTMAMGPGGMSPDGMAPDAHGGHGGHGGLPAPALYAVQSGPLGVVLTDGAGHLMYRSDADKADPSTSTCSDPCTQTWIPVTAPAGEDLELAGVDRKLVGRLQRTDGSSQLTLAGWPLYRNRDDDGSLTTDGENGADGKWFVVTPKGDKVTGS